MARHGTGRLLPPPPAAVHVGCMHVGWHVGVAFWGCRSRWRVSSMWRGMLVACWVSMNTLTNTNIKYEDEMQESKNYKS